MNRITLNGIEIATVTEIVNNIINGTDTVDGLKTIFGTDVNFDQDSPDAQLVNIYAQAERDALEFAVTIFNSMDPDQASGDTLDARVLYNGVQRKTGEPTQITVNITFTQLTTITGINDDLTGSRENVFTVADDNGNLYYLLNTFTPDATGTYGKLFVSAEVGDIYVKPDLEMTITTPDRGVVRAVYANLRVKGYDEETDEMLRIRRAKAVGVGMLGSVEVLQSSLRQLPYVKEAVVFENHTSFTDLDGIPPHSVWVIVRGGVDKVIASCIYLRLNAGCGMKGDTTVYVNTIDGQTLPISFDQAVEENVSVKFTVTAENYTEPYNADLIIQSVIDNYNLAIWEPATSTDLDRVLDNYSSKYVYTDIAFSTDPNTKATIYTEDVTDNFTALEAVTNGAFKITVDSGTPVEVTGLNFTLITESDDVIEFIANVINSAFTRLGVEAKASKYDDGQLQIESNLRGASGSVVVAQTTTGEVDISEATLLNLANATYVPGHDATYSTVVSQDIADITPFQSVNNGKLKVTNGATIYQLEDLNFTSCQSLYDIAAVLSADAFNRSFPFTASVSGVAIQIISNVAGGSVSLNVGSSTGGTDLYSSTYLGGAGDYSTIAGTAATNGSCTTTTIDVSEFQTVSNGALSIQVNNDAFVTAKNLDFTECSTVQAIANVIAAGIATARCTVSVDGSSIVFYSNVAGQNSTIRYQAAPITYTQLCSSSYLGDVSSWTTVAGVSPVEWKTLLYPSTKKNVFVFEKSYFSVTDGNE